MAIEWVFFVLPMGYCQANYHVDQYRSMLGMMRAKQGMLLVRSRSILLPKNHMTGKPAAEEHGRVRSR